MIDFDRLEELGDLIAENKATDSQIKEYAKMVDSLEEEDPIEDVEMPQAEVLGALPDNKKLVYHQCYYCNTIRNVIVDKKDKYLEFTCGCGVIQKDEIRKLKEVEPERVVELLQIMKEKGE